MVGAYLALIETTEEKSKFEELYKKYRTMMYNQAYSILKDKYLAEDAVHNAFLKLTDNLDKIKKIKCKETRNYLVILVRGISINAYNKNKRIIPIDELEDIDNFDLPNTVEGRLERRRIFKIIKNMDKNYSDILMLKLFYELSNEEISKILDITPENVSVRFFRAKNKLKQLILEEYKDD